MALFADQILVNGRIYTQSSAKPLVSALAVQHGRIVAVGADDAIRSLAGPNTQIVDLVGRAVLPGFTDSHIHWQWTSTAMHEVDVFEVPSKTAALEAVASHVAMRQPGEWIRGHGWAQDLWPDRQFPTAQDLDQVAPHNPVLLTGKSVHVAWANSLALQMAGIDAQTPDPPGGEIQRGAQGNPTGILFERPAMALVMNCIPKLTTEHLAQQMLAAQAKAHQAGLTAIHDLDDPDCLVALQTLRERGELGLRVTKYINKDYLEAAITSGIRFGLGDDWLRFGGLKLFADGALGPRTAHMIDPYENEPANIGIVVTPKAEMQHFVRKASEAGLPTAIHAIGDRAVRDVLDIFADVRDWEASQGIAPTARRHRIEHVQLIHPDDVTRLAQLNLIASMQPIHATSDAEVADRHWGDRAALSYNARVQLDQGAVVAFGSDSPIEPFDVFQGIYAAVTRQRVDGSLGDGWRTDATLTVEEAIRAYTVGAAYAAGSEAVQGQLAPGYLADLIVLDQNPYQIPSTDLHSVRVVATMVDGSWRYGEYA